MRGKFEKRLETLLDICESALVVNRRQTIKAALGEVYRTGLEDAAKIAVEFKHPLSAWEVFNGYEHQGFVTPKEVAEAILKEAKEQP